MLSFEGNASLFAVQDCAMIDWDDVATFLPSRAEARCGLPPSASG